MIAFDTLVFMIFMSDAICLFGMLPYACCGLHFIDSAACVLSLNHSTPLQINKLFNEGNGEDRGLFTSRRERERGERDRGVRERGGTES